MSNESFSSEERENDPRGGTRWAVFRRRIAKLRETGAFRFVAEQPAGLAVCFVAFVLYVSFYVTVRMKDMPGNADPHYIWMYARSLVYDHDFDFTNDYRLCGDPFRLGKTYGTHHPDNPYYVGPTLFLAPALVLFRAILPVSAGASPDVVAACRGPIAGASMGVGCLLGAISLFFAYRMARRFTTDGVAAVAAALFGWSGLLAAYSGLWPNYSHVFSTFGVALVALTTLRAMEKSASLWRWGAVALAIALGTWQRPPQLLYVIVPFGVAVWRFRGERPLFARITFLLASGCVLGVVPLLLHYKNVYGSYWTSPIHGPYLHLTHAHPFLLLFAPHGGLFYVTPVVWVAVAGLYVTLRNAQWRCFILPLLVAGALEGYLYSAGLDWHGAGTFGARRLTSLTPLFVVLAAVFLDKLASWLEARPKRALVALSLAVVVPMGALTQGMMLGQARGTIPCCRGASQAELYGEGTKAIWSAVDAEIGDLAVLPASLVFAARYRLAPNRFRDASQSRFYVRDFRTLVFHAQGFSFHDPNLVVDGLTKVKHGARLRTSRARAIFAAEWPYATKLTLRVRSSKPGYLRVGFGQTAGVTWIGETEIGPDLQEPRVLAISPGAFDSGIVEMVFEVRGVEPADVELERLQFDDEGTY